MVTLASWAARFDWMAHLGKAVFQNHDKALRTVLSPYIPHDAVVFDVGAHAGQMAKLFARLAVHGKVYAFEPGSYALSILRPAIRMSGLPNVEIVPAGLSDSGGQAILRMPVKKHGGYGFGTSSLRRDLVDRPTVDEQITLMSLDSFVEERALTRLDFVKVDIEGWESQFLKGATNSIRQFLPTLMIEIVTDFLRGAGSTPSDIVSPLAALGYRAWNMAAGQTSEGCLDDGDYLFVPPGRSIPAMCAPRSA